MPLAVDALAKPFSLVLKLLSGTHSGRLYAEQYKNWVSGTLALAHFRAPATGPCPCRRPSVGNQRLFKGLRPTAGQGPKQRGEQGKRARGLGAAGGRRGVRRGGGWGSGNGQRSGRRSRGAGR